MKGVSRSRMIALLLLLAAHSGYAYQPPTHADISEQALRASIVATAKGPLRDLGLKSLEDYGPTFIDSNGDSRALLYFVRRGAVLEDEGLKSLNHFFDPLHHRALTVPGLNKLFSPLISPDWALEDNSSNDSNLCMQGVITVCQDYSVADARAYFMRALTDPDSRTRNQSFGKLFESLGHIIHHVEDMAQPQHVRNDVHCDKLICRFVGKYSPSAYEDYTNLNRKDLVFGGYLPVKFDAARKYWYTKSDDAGSGMAEFTNSNFVSAGTNFVVDGTGTPSTGREYALPVPVDNHDNAPVATLYAELGKRVPEEIAALCADSQKTCSVSFYGNYVLDKLQGTSSFNQRAASLSIFDEDLQERFLTVHYPGWIAHITQVDTSRLFTLNSFNYRADWRYLIPRAVGYSAGLINYFFRGKLDFQRADNGDGWVVKNIGEYPMQGNLQVYYDGNDGKRYPVPNAGWNGVQLQPGAAQTLQFDSPVDPPNDTPQQYLIVFKGTIGKEDGVAAKLYKPKPEEAYVYMADSDASPGALRLYKEDGTTARNLPLLWGTSSYYCCAIAVYGGAVYMTDFQSVAMQRNDAVKGLWDDSQHKYPGITQYPDAVAVNSQTVYATVGVSNCLPGLPCSEYEDIYRFDHDGNSLGVISHIGTWDYSTGGFAANDSRLCVSDWDDQIGPSTKLLDLNGNVVASLPVGDWEGGPCALTKDRLFYMREYSDAYSEISLADLNGNIIDSQPLGPIDGDEDGTWEGTAIAADDNYVFIADFDAPRIIVFKRIVDRDAAGNIISEHLVRQPNIKIGSSNWYTKLALDMANVLHN